MSISTNMPNPYGTYPGQVPYGGGNPANSGYAPQVGSAGMGPLIDMLVSGIASQLGGRMAAGSPMSTFGRPQVSDYAHRSMQQRDFYSSQAMSGVYGSNPANRTFGTLGNNGLFQQFAVDNFLSGGGSRSEQFKQTLGRFGTTIGGVGMENLAQSTKKAAQFMRNVDNGFTDDMGMWDYNKTAGFNRSNFTGAVGAYVKQFGGEGVIRQLAEEERAGSGGVRGGGKGNKDAIAKARASIQEMAETVREAGNLFGPDMPFGQLMQEVNSLIGEGTKISAGDVKSMMQKIQATAVVVDMSNEAFTQYIKAVQQMGDLSGSGVDGVDLAVSSMMSGKAIGDVERRRAESSGVQYTGPDDQSRAMEISRAVQNREASSNAIRAKVMTQELIAASPNDSIALRVAQLTSEGKYEEAMMVAEGNVSSGRASGAFSSAYQTGLGRFAKYENGQMSWDESQERAYRENQGRLGNNVLSGGALVESSLRETISKTLNRASMTNADLMASAGLFGGAGQMQTFLTDKDILSSGNLSDPIALKNAIMTKAVAQGISMTDAEAAKLAGGLRGGLEDQFTNADGVFDKNALTATFDILDPEKRQDIINAANKQQRVQEDIAGLKNQYSLLSDAGIGEKAIQAGIGVINDLSADGRVTVDGAIDALKERGAIALFGNENRARAVVESKIYEKQISARMQEKLKAIKDTEGVELSRDSDRYKQLQEDVLMEVLPKDSILRRSLERKEQLYSEKLKSAKNTNVGGDLMQATIESAERLAKEKGHKKGSPEYEQIMNEARKKGEAEKAKAQEEFAKAESEKALAAEHEAIGLSENKSDKDGKESELIEAIKKLTEAILGKKADEDKKVDTKAWGEAGKSYRSDAISAAG